MSRRLGSGGANHGRTSWDWQYPLSGSPLRPMVRSSSPWEPCSGSIPLTGPFSRMVRLGRGRVELSATLPRESVAESRRGDYRLLEPSIWGQKSCTQFGAPEVFPANGSEVTQPQGDQDYEHYERKDEHADVDLQRNREESRHERNQA